MTLIKNLKKYLTGPKATEMNAEAAYDIWSRSYDSQPDNLMLHLDELVFLNLLSQIPITGKRVVDFGCGTGRHWTKILELNPDRLTGFDVSNGMLAELKKKFPSTEVHLSADNRLDILENESVDLIISTLTIAHIENIEEVFANWKRVLRTGGNIILTDYHPSLLAKGGKRDFTVSGKHIVITNFVHSIQAIIDLAEKNDFELISKDERFIDERVRRFYLAQNALPVYEKFKGMPVIYGLHLHKL